MREMARQPPAEGRGAVNSPTSAAAPTAGAVVRAQQPGCAPATTPSQWAGFALPPQTRSSDDTVAALLQQLHLQQQQHLQQLQQQQLQQQQLKREHREEMAEMKRYIMEALGRPNIGEAEPTHPQGSEMGHLGYGPPLPPPPPDPQAGFQEEYGGSDRVSPPPATTARPVHPGF